MKRPPSKAQSVLAYVSSHLRKFGRWPSHHQIADAMGVHTERVNDLLVELVVAGKLERTQIAPRGTAGRPKYYYRLTSRKEAVA